MSSHSSGSGKENPVKESKNRQTKKNAGIGWDIWNLDFTNGFVETKEKGSIVKKKYVCQSLLLKE